MEYAYCYYCEQSLILLGQQTRCERCQSGVARLSQGGYVHHQTATTLQAQAAQRRQAEQR